MFNKPALITATIILLGLQSIPARAESFDAYVAACKDKLDFDSIPKFSCKDVQFRKATNIEYLDLDFSESDDFVGHKRINNSVDAVFACRWVERNGNKDRAVGGEMIVHNRRTGGTCYFELKDLNENAAYPQVALKPESPTSSGASALWNAGKGCTQCHVAGPYIASPQIVGALARFGLINDGHDTFNKIYKAVGATNSSIASALNAELKNVSKLPCASACHVVRAGPEVPSRIGAGLVFGAVVMPSIDHVIADIAQTGKMPPSNDQSSHYRWLNRDDPGSTADNESIPEFERDKAEGKRDFSQHYCSNPRYSQIQAVDGQGIVSSTTSAKLRKFNLIDGLVCSSADFPANDPFKCLDFQTRYMCDGAWTPWRGHAPTASGDDESRARFKATWGLCSNPTDIQARQQQPISGAPYGDPINAPRDYLRQFNNLGMVCKHEDQPSGKSCSNYSVRFICN